VKMKLLEFKIFEKVTSAISTNKIYAGMHWSKRKEIVDSWHEIIYYTLLQQNIKRELFKQPVDIIVYSDDDLDADNHFFLIKLIVDTLKEYELIVEDNRKYVKSVKFEFYKEEGIKVEIYGNNTKK